VARLVVRSRCLAVWATRVVLLSFAAVLVLLVLAATCALPRVLAVQRRAAR
jgi:hypothetical protein